MIDFKILYLCSLAKKAGVQIPESKRVFASSSHLKAMLGWNVCSVNCRPGISFDSHIKPETFSTLIYKINP